MQVATVVPLKRASWFALSFAVAVALAMARAPATLGGDAGEQIRATLRSGMDSLSVALDGLQSSAQEASRGDRRFPEIGRSLRRARLAYKSVEGLLEYFDGMTATQLNGRDAENDDPDDSLATEPPSGFAALDSLLTADSDSSAPAVARRAMLMARSVRYSRSLIRHFAAGEAQLFDAAQLEIARITTLGLGGYDARLPEARAPETAAALRGLRRAMADCLAGATGATQRARRETDARFAAAIARLEASTPSDLDAFVVIAGYLGPLARAIDAERLARGVTLPGNAGAWRASSGFIFDRDAFDPLAYAAGFETDSGVALTALGQALFFDPMLSGDGTRSCASCHHPDRAFSENRARTATIDSLGRERARNTPTLINAALQPAFFADLRVRSLEDQVAAVVASPSEMRGSLEAAAARLSQDAARRRAFAAAFRASPAASVTPRQIQGAIAAYLRSLIALDSRFDRGVRGDTSVLSASERRGFNTFMGKARCGSCHFAPMFGGTLPPDYWATPPEVIGVPSAADGSVVDPDLGRGAIDGLPPHRHAFKTPSLRNVALTAPYMHNGAFRTLDEVIDFYDRGGAAGLGIDLPNQTLRRQPLGLTVAERADIIAFLGSLTDTVVSRR